MLVYSTLDDSMSSICNLYTENVMELSAKHKFMNCEDSDNSVELFVTDPSCGSLF